MLVSHSQDFLNGVCTNIIHLFKRQLYYYGVSHVTVTWDGYVIITSRVTMMHTSRQDWNLRNIK